MIKRAIDDLTGREQEVLTHVASGKSNKEVAQALVISEATVENHLTSIYRKWYVSSRTEASYHAYHLGLAA